MFACYKDAETALLGFLEAPAMLKIKNTEYRLYYRLNLFPSQHIFGVFNKIVKTKSSITLSIEKRDCTSYLQQLQKYCDNRKSKDIEYQFDHELKIDGRIPFDNADKYFLVEQVIKNVFSNEFIIQNGLERNTINEKITCIQRVNQPTIEQKSLLPILRFEEKIDDLRIVLTISTVDMDIKLAFCSLKDKGIFNPITEYFFSTFNWQPLKFARFESKHYVRFLEKQGHKYYPLAHNNVQSFLIKFNLYAEGNWKDIVTTSFRSLKVQLSSLLTLMDLLFGQDLYNRNQILTKHDQYDEVNENATSEKLKLLFGKRVYSGPEYDILLEFQPSVNKDDNEKEFIVAELSINVTPFDNEEKPDEGIFHHPLIYELGK